MSHIPLNSVPKIKMNETYNSQEPSNAMFYNNNSTPSNDAQSQNNNNSTGNSSVVNAAASMHANNGNHNNDNINTNDSINENNNNNNGNNNSNSSGNTNNNNKNKGKNKNNSGNSNNHTVNELYGLIHNLQSQFAHYQNTQFNQLMMKISFLHDSMDHMKLQVNDLSQQVLFLAKNSGMISGTNSNPNSTFNNQFKAFEVFTKHLNELNKEIEEISSSSQGIQNQQQQQQQHQQQQQQLHQPHHQAQIPPPPSHPPQQTLQLQSNHSQFQGPSVHLGVPLNSNGPPASQFDEEVDSITRKGLSLRSPANSSPNPTSHYVFDVGPFASRNMNGNNANNLYDKGPTTSVIRPNKKRRKQQKNSQEDTPANEPESTLQLQRRLPVQQQSRQTLAQSSSTYPNSYILPMPPLLSDDKLGQNLGSSTNNDPTQFMLQRDNGTVMTSALRQPPNHTRPPPNQQTASGFSFDDEIDSIEQLENDKQNEGSSSESAKRTSKKRKQSESGKMTISVNPLNIPQYKLERSLKSLAEIWKEYAHGLNNKPPLKSLETKYGTKWRNETESRTFLRRKKIYEAIEIGISKGYTEDEVIQELEMHRSYNKNGVIKRKPLLWLSSNMPEKFNSPT